MKSILFNLILTVCSIRLIAQTVSSIATLPASATSTDNIKIVVTTSFPGGACSLFSSFNPTTSNDTIIAEGIYCYESNAGGCSSTDTFTIGQLAAGNWTVRFRLTSTDSGAPCGSVGFSLKDIEIYNFTVTNGTTGIAPQSTAAVYHAPNPVTGNVTFSVENNTTQSTGIILRDISGKTVQTASFSKGSPLIMDISQLPASIYYYTVQAGNKIVTGKLLKQ